MKAEVLFPEVGNLSGDLMNIRYLKQCCDKLEIVETDLKSRPAFLDEEVALVYMGTATETGLALAAEALRPYLDEIRAKIDAGQLMLLTGNAQEVFGSYIDSDQAERMEGLGILPIHAEYHMMQRHNSFFLGTFGETKIVGFKSLFGHTYPDGECEALFHTLRGVGRSGGSEDEGYRMNNLLATALTGPLLVLNPPFTKALLRMMGAEDDALAFEEAAMEAYRVRVAEFSDEHRDPIY